MGLSYIFIFLYKKDGMYFLFSLWGILPDFFFLKAYDGCWDLQGHYQMCSWDMNLEFKKKKSFLSTLSLGIQIKSVIQKLL